MKLGVDFGTTRIVAAACDRGNFPVVNFECPDGSARDWFPPLLAVSGGERLYGWHAWAAQEDPQAIVVRSLKRALADAGPQTLVALGEQQAALATVLAELTAALKQALIESSTLRLKADDALEIMLGVPANANSNQRFLTVEAFRASGFMVLGLLNEPSAAAIEYGHSQRGRSPARDRILVYDLGGGTFDASLVELNEKAHGVIASEGIATLGGDDFDEVLADLALELAGIGPAGRDSLHQGEVFRLFEECRAKKEALHPNTRRIIVDLETVRAGWGAVSVPVADFYGRCRPLVEETLNAAEDLIAGQEGIEALYVTGGGSELPLVARALRERFGRRVKRSAYTRSATAVGLAIQADAATGYVLREKFTRYFGVWREREGGRVMAFDPLFSKGLELPHAGDAPLTQVRAYTSAHNIGHFRYLECSHLREWGEPAGDITIWDEIRFPFDPALAETEDLTGVPVVHAWPGQEVEERYVCDAGGTVTVTISNLSADYERTYKLGRWSQKETTIVPGKRKRAARKHAG